MESWKTLPFSKIMYNGALSRIKKMKTTFNTITFTCVR
jgi:hypothetical protein